MAGNPFDQFDTQQQTGPVYGLPLHPPQQTPDQAIGQGLQNTHTAQEIASQPLQNANTQTNIAQGQTSIASQQQQMRQSRATTASGLYKDYTSDPTVKAYREVIPQVAQAMTSAPGGPGDISVIYAWAKAMDPTGSVREGDVQLGQSATGPLQQAQFMVSQYHLQDGGKLPPEVRVGLIEAMRNKARQLDHQYSAVHDHYIQTAQASGIDPLIIGPHEGQMYQPAEEQYITAHGGTPKIAGVPVTGGPVASGGGTQQGFDLTPDPRQSSLTPEQTDAYKAWWKAHPDPSPDQLNSFLHSMGVPGNVANADAIIASAKKGRISTDVEIKPDISDVRGGSNTVGQDRINATVRGVLDTPSMGTIDKVVAGTDTLFKGGTMDDNLRRQYAISDYDQQNHPGFRIGGQILGGGLMPMGEMKSIPQIALKSGALGAAYGAGSSRSLSDVPQNALLGAVSGAAIGGAVSAAGRGVAALRGRGAVDVPPLVDPVSGRLNEPLEAAGPAARVNAAQQFGIDLPMGSAGDKTATIVERKLDVRPASAGVMNDHRRVVEDQVQNAVEGVAGKFGSSRTLNEGGSEVQRGAKEWMTRFDATTSKAYDAIPISPKAPTTLANTKGTLEQLAGKLESNRELQQEIRDPTLLRYLDAINKGGLDWQGIKEFRTFIGNKIGQFRFSEDARTGDYRALYGALSGDMRASASAQGPRALSAFERANSLKADGERRIDESLSRILGPSAQGSPEKAASAIQSMTKGGKSTGDLRALAQVRASTVKSGAWDEIAGTLIRIGGQPANSPGRGFDPGTFVRWYSDMAEPARGMLFKPELRKSLDQFVMVNQRLANSNALRNTSNTAMASPTGTFSIPTAGAAVLTGHPMIAGGILAATAAKTASEFGMATLWTKPAFVQWATGYSRAASAGNANAVKSQIGRLGRLAATNPELRAPLIALQQKLLSGANDNAMMGAVASQPNSEEQ